MNTPEFSKNILTIELFKDINKEIISFENYSFRPAENIIFLKLSKDKKEEVISGIYYKEKELCEIISEDEDVFGTMKTNHQYNWAHQFNEKNGLQRFSICEEDLTSKVMTKYRFIGRTTNHSPFNLFRNIDAINPYQEYSKINVLEKDEEILGLPKGTYKHVRNFDILIQKSNTIDDYTFLRVISFELEKNKYTKTEITHEKKYGRKI